MPIYIIALLAGSALSLLASGFIIYLIAWVIQAMVVVFAIGASALLLAVVFKLIFKKKAAKTNV